MAPSPLKAVIFDFDGLILDTEWPEVLAWEEVFRAKNLVLPEGWWITSIGRGAEHEHPTTMFAAMVSECVSPDELEREQEVAKLKMLDREPIRPGVLDRLAEAEELSLKLGVASSSGHAWVEGFLERLGILQRFQTIRCSEDVKHTKPDPTLYRLAIQDLNCEPGDAVALEDSPNGVAAAKAAGLFTVAVPNRLTAQLDLSHADLVLDSLEQLSFRNLDRRTS